MAERKASAIAKTILLGILGAALFAWAVKPLGEALAPLVVGKAGSVLGWGVNYLVQSSSSGWQGSPSSLYVEVWVDATLATVMWWLATEGMSEPVTRKRRAWRVAAAILVTLSLGKTLISHFTSQTLNERFSRRMSTVAPLIDDQQEEELRAAWSQMRTLDDFRAIDSRIDRFLHEK